MPEFKPLPVRGPESAETESWCQGLWILLWTQATGQLRGWGWGWGSFILYHLSGSSQALLS